MEATARETLVKLFLQSKPYELHYRYREKYGKAAHKRDLPVLRKMSAAGEIELYEVDHTWKKYRYLKA
jgi:hypothetical protein